MDTTKTMTNIRYKYHTTVFKLARGANKLGLLNDHKTMQMWKNHILQSLDCLDKLGRNTEMLRKEVESL